MLVRSVVLGRHLAAVVIIAFALALALALTACGQAGSSDSAAFKVDTPGSNPQPGGTLVWDQVGEQGTFDPVIPRGPSDLPTDQQIYDQLVEFTPASKHEVVPALATSWKVGDGGLRWTFDLRKGVQFSDGTPVTADDVVFSLQREALPENGDDQACCRSYERVYAPNDSQVVIELKPTGPSRGPALLGSLATTAASIVPKAYFTRLGAEGFGKRPIGTGPFMVESFERGRQIVLVRNPNYWRRDAGPYVDKVVIHPVTNPNARILDVRSGEANVADAIPYSQLRSLQATPGVAMVVSPRASVSLVYLNGADPLLEDARIRKALSYATPREDILNAVFHGYAEIANAPWGNYEDWDANLRQLPYSPAKAKELLADTSAPDGFPVSMQVIAGDSDALAVATILQNSWKQIGVRVKITQVDAGTFYGNQSGDAAGKYQTQVLPVDGYWSDVPQPEELAGITSYDIARANYSNYRSAKAMELYKQATSANDDAERQSAWYRLQAHVTVDDPPVLALAWTRLRTLVSSDVCNFQPMFTGDLPLDQVYLAKSCG